MNSQRLSAFTAAAVLVTSAASAQITGSVSTTGCSSIISDNAAAGAELFAYKTLNPGSGPDEHTDMVFDVSAKGGGAVTGTSVGGPMYTIPDNFHHNTVPPEELFVLITYPGGYLAADSISMRGGPDSMGVVQRHKVGDSLPVGVDNGIGLVLPGDARSYTAGIMDQRTGRLAQFPYGTASGIQVAFAPIAEINSTQIGGTGCTVGGDVLDQNAGFGSITGYNVYRIPGIPGRVPTTADFVGGWQYYISLTQFDMTLADGTGSSGPDRNGDTLPDGDGTMAANDGQPNDLAGINNPDGRPWSGDEVVIFQDSATNPDGTPRISGTGPDLNAGQGYWYAFQPVLFQGATTLEAWDGLSFSRADEFQGIHAIDTDGDGIVESIDLDMDGSAEFYSPQVVIGQTGLGLTNGGLPLLSAPVFGRANAAIALGEPQVTTSVAGNQVQLQIHAPTETSWVVGYEVRRTVGTRTSDVTLGMIPARGGEGNTYVVTDALRSERRLAPQVSYTVTRILTGNYRQDFGPFVIEEAEIPQLRRRR